MDMKDGLPSHGLSVYPDIEAIYRRFCSGDLSTLFFEPQLDRVQFGLIEVEVIGHMPLGDDQRCIDVAGNPSRIA